MRGGLMGDLDTTSLTDRDDEKRRNTVWHGVIVGRNVALCPASWG
jgi:hypothetical protein